MKSLGKPRTKSPATKPAKPPDEVASKSLTTKPVKRAGKPTTKSPAKKPAKSFGKPVAKSPVAKYAKSFGRPAVKFQKQKHAKSPRIPGAKSSAKKPRIPVTKIGKSLGSSAKSPVMKNTKSDCKPEKFPVKPHGSPGKLPGHKPAKSPVKLLAKSPVKTPTKSHGKLPTSHAKLTASVVKKKSSIGRLAIKSPDKGKASPHKSTVKKSPRKAATQNISSSLKTLKLESPAKKIAKKTPNKPTLSTHGGKLRKVIVVKASPNKSPTKKSPRKAEKTLKLQSPAKKTTNKTPSKPTLSTHAGSPRKAIVVSSTKMVPAISKKILVKKVTVNTSVNKHIPVTQILQSTPRLPKKRSALTAAGLPSPAKKTKVDATFTALQRPSRVVSPPARLLEANVIQSPKRGLQAGWKETKSSPFKSPPNPTRVITPAEKKPALSEIRTVKLMADRTTKRAASALVGNQQGKQISNRPPVKKKMSKPSKSTNEPRKEVNATRGIAKITKGNAQKTPEKPVPPTKPVSPKSASHPCTHCGLMFRSHSDAELHEHRCNKNPSRTDTRYPCNKCSGTFTMSDLILHKKQAHPQRDQPHPDFLEVLPATETPEETPADRAPPAALPPPAVGVAEIAAGTSKKEVQQCTQVKKITAAKKVAVSPQIRAPPGGLVLKVPVTGNLSDVIRQAVHAAANAGLIPSYKKIVISGQHVKSGAEVAGALSDKVILPGSPKLKRNPQEKSSAPVTDVARCKVTPQESPKLNVDPLEKSSRAATDAAGHQLTPQMSPIQKGNPQETAAKKAPTSAKRVRFEKLPVRVEYPSPAMEAASQGMIPLKEKKVTHVPNEAMQDEDSKRSQPKFFTCLDCGDIFPSRKRVSEHKGECPCVGKTSVHACMDCNTTFIGRNELNIHRREKHPPQKRKAKSANVTIRSFKCSECELFFPIESEAKQHITEIHGGVGVSSMCNVVATPDALRSVDWNRNISEEMVEEVIKNIVNGTRKVPVSDSCTDTPPVSPSVGLTTTSSPVPIPTPVNPIAEQNVSAEEDIPAENDMPEEQIVHKESSASEAPNTPVHNTNYSGDRKPGQCLDCFMKVSSRLELANHKRHCQIAIQNRQLFCFVCGSSFRSYFELSRHKQEQHKGSPQNLKCVPCKTVYKTNCEWLEHQNKHHQSSPLRQRSLTQQKATADKDNSNPRDNSNPLPKVTTTAKQALDKPVNEQEKHPEQVKGSKSETKKNPEPGKNTEVRTRSGRVVHKKKLDGEIVVEHVKPKKAKNVPEPPNPIGTIEIVPQDEDGVIALGEVSSKNAIADQQKEMPQPAGESGHPTVVSIPQPAGESGHSTVVSSPYPSHKPEEKKDDHSRISFADGLVTIAAERADDYEILVDEKEDGSIIQLKLIRKESIAEVPNKAGATAMPMKLQAKPSKVPATKKDTAHTKRNKNKTPISAMKAKPAIAATKKATAPATIKKKTGMTKKTTASAASNKIQEEVPKTVIASAASNKIQEEVSIEVGEILTKTNLTTVAVAATPIDEVPNTSNPPVDTAGKVVQKGKPFVIGGQTLVPIQFPPGFQLPGGATGGQKVFAIPSTNLPPGLLQLLAKQQKAATAAASWPPKPVPPKKIAPKLSDMPGISQKRPGNQSSQTKSPKNVGMPASLKGMTGAQLMARAQARILGRPLPPLVVEAAAIQAAAAKAAKAAKATKALPTKKAQSLSKVATPGKSKAAAKNTVTIMPPNATSTKPPGKSATPVKTTTSGKKTPLVKGPGTSKKPTAVHIIPQSNEAVKPSTYNDPLFVYQCTSCKKNFKSTADINKHIPACVGGEMEPPVKRPRKAHRQTGTDVWHMKPVASQKGRGAMGKGSDPQGVEWFVASKRC